MSDEIFIYGHTGNSEDPPHRFRIQIFDDKIIATVRIALVPQPGVSPETVQRIQDEARRGIAKFYSDRANLRDENGKTRAFEVKLAFVDSGEDARITLVPGEPSYLAYTRMDQWVTGTRDPVHAWPHEVTHWMGVGDE